MSIVVKLRNQKDLVKFSKTSRNVRLGLVEFRKAKLREIANSTLLVELKNRMAAQGYHSKIIDGTFISDVIVTDTEFEIIVKSEAIVITGFDIAAGKEKGIREFDVEGILQVFEVVDGTVFTMKTHHPAIPGTNLIKDTTAEFKPIIQNLYQTAEKLWLEANFNG